MWIVRRSSCWQRSDSQFNILNKMRSSLGIYWRQLTFGYQRLTLKWCKNTGHSSRQYTLKTQCSITQSSRFIIWLVWWSKYRQIPNNAVTTIYESIKFSMDKTQPKFQPKSTSIWSQLLASWNVCWLLGATKFCVKLTISPGPLL